ncbi:MAG: phosphotransferase [Hydrogenophaga sp.]|uniref:phosphotransferase family protein n=1 Tax=Hydrogenophaga sp. TaxID=1904254 RepID=UPI0026056391|nr:phosphotransferase [Hydrogenophaga sp.]MDM7942281.1 phosphotransferase [Hydrogenophaga sp.]
MSPSTDLIDHLRLALQAQGHPAAGQALERLPDKGLAHDHVRLAGTGALARIPKQSQLGLAAQDNLDYQRACFERAAPAGHTPALLGVLPPSTHLPRGALLVQAITGRPARLPQDLPALATALAALHALPVPAPAGRAPLLHAHDPLQALAQEIEAQARHLGAAGLPAAVQDAIERERQRLQSCLQGPARPARCLIAFDAHPGNFIVQPDGRAVLVDLEKCRYAHPGLDLAHATLYTSTTWDLDSQAVLTVDEVLGFHAAWAAAVGPLAAGARPWHGPLRRAMWLWSVTWCAKWRALSPQAARAGADGEDWSGERSEAALVDHVRNRVDHYLQAEVVQEVIEGFDRFERGLRA